MFCEKTRIVTRRLCGEASELLQLPHVGIVFDCSHAFDYLGTFRNGRHSFAGVTNFGIRYVLVLEVDGVGKPFPSRCLDMAIVQAVMVFRREKIPSIDRMIMPGSALVVFLMYLRPTSHWSKRNCIIVERSAEMSVCRYVWGSVRLS